jgi:hypothetical protein
MFYVKSQLGRFFVKRRQMATPARPKSGSRSAPASRMAKSEKAPVDLRRSFFSVLLWGLGLVNVLLIASSVRNHFATGNEHTIISDAAVVAEPNTVMKIEVLNGCGVDGLARKFADYLRKQGFDPVTVANYERDDIPRTMIIDRTSNALVNARKVAQALGRSDDYVSYLASRSEDVIAVRVIIGQDYKSIQLAPK